MGTTYYSFEQQTQTSDFALHGFSLLFKRLDTYTSYNHSVRTLDPRHTYISLDTLRIANIAKKNTQ